MRVALLLRQDNTCGAAKSQQIFSAGNRALKKSSYVPLHFLSDHCIFLKIMNLILSKIETGCFKLDGGAMFGVVPKTMWSKVYPADERNLCNLSLRCLLVQTAGRVILIDTGLGAKQPEKFYSHYELNGADSLAESLAACALGLEEVTDVLLTHLHFDHAGGAVLREPGSGRLHPTFPQARYWVSRDQWQWACEPNRREGASFFTENFRPLEEAGVLNLLQAEGELAPGISIRLFQGHTSGLAVPVITYGEEKLVYVSDLIPTSAHVPVAWVCAYDTRPLISFKEREDFLHEACREEYTLFFEHDLYTECCSLEETEKGVRVKAAFSLQEFLKN